MRLAPASHRTASRKSGASKVPQAKAGQAKGSGAQAVANKAKGVKAAAKRADSPKAGVTRRLSATEREERITQEAIHFFSEVGFGGDTRQLARRLGVTQSLLYKYFPNKEALINRVFEVVYMGRWNPFWESVIADRRVPLQARLTRLYIEYAKAALTRDWVRIFMFSGLRGEDINRKYLAILRKRILEPIAIELRHEFSLPTVAEFPLCSAEVELVWSNNARVFYFGQRQWIFDVPLEDKLDDMIELTVVHFLAGAKVVLPGVLARARRQHLSGKS